MSFRDRALAFAQRHHFALAAMLLCLLAYAPLISTLGFYWDDWLVIFHAQSGRLAEMPQMYAYDRPFSVWTTLFSVPLLGSQPLAWHLFALVARWLLVLAMAWSLSLAWPRARGAVQWAALLFAVYPAYQQQPIAVAFSQHLLAYLLFFISLAAMLLAVRQPARRWRWTALALLAQVMHLLTVEHFAGLELLRPVLLYAALANEMETKRERLRAALTQWLPYSAVLGLVTVWRLVLLELPVEPHPPELLLALRANPLQALVDLAVTAAQGVVHVLVDVWSATLRSGLFTLDDRGALFAWAFGLLAALATVWWGRRKLTVEDGDQAPVRAWSLLGPLALVVGLLPAWIIGEQILQRGYHEHLVLPALLGGTLFWVGLIYTLVAQRRQRLLIFAVLIGLAVASQLRQANELRNDWQAQQDFYQQLQLRAPGIEPDTVLVSFERLTTYTQNSSLSAALNTLYPQSQAAPHLDFWNFEAGLDATQEALADGIPFERDYRSLQFRGESADAVLIYFVPEVGCLWILSPLDIHNGYLPGDHRELAAYSNLSRIQREAAGSDYDASHIFGALNPDSWCSYYQQAELARQFRDWTAVVALYEQAFAAGQNPDNGLELLGLVDAYAHLGDWDQALDISRQVAGRQQLNQTMLCALWDEFAAKQTLGTPADALAEVRQLANCDQD